VREEKVDGVVSSILIIVSGAECAGNAPMIVIVATNIINGHRKIMIFFILFLLQHLSM